MQLLEQADKEAPIATTAAGTSPIADMEEFLVGDEEGDEGMADEECEGEDFTFEVKGSICNVKIDNCDLPLIVNGFLGDQMGLRPFDYIFHHKNIWKLWCRVGFIPMTRNCLHDDKIRLQLGGEKAVIRDQGEMCISSPFLIIRFNSYNSFLLKRR